MQLPDLASNVWKRVWEHDVFGRAAQLAYFFLLSLFPFLLFLTALLGTFVESSAALRTRLLEYFGALAPGDLQSLKQDSGPDQRFERGRQGCARLLDRNLDRVLRHRRNSGRPSAGLWR